jgi:hypothetical protein
MNPITGQQPPELSPRTAYLEVSTTGKNWRLDWGPPGRRRLPHRSREGVSEAVATRQVKSDPRPRVSAHRGRSKDRRSFVMTRRLRRLEPHEEQAGRWHGPCPDVGKPATGSILAVSSRRTGCTVQADTASEWTQNTPHPLRGRRIAHGPGIASLDPIRQARSCQRGRGTGPLSHAGILALQRGEDVKRGYPPRGMHLGRYQR